jgi:BON domain
MARGRGKLLVGLGLGWLFGYLFDPRQGKRRRRVGSDWTLARLRRAWRRGERAQRYAVSTVAGKAQAVLHAQGGSGEPVDDATLAHKVQSIVFRDPHVPKGRISINAERGVVYLRGEVPDRTLIDELVAKVREVQGVRDVESLLHLPGEPGTIHGS